MADWTADIETTIFSVIKTKTYSTLVSKYPNINYTTEETTSTTAKFPNVYVHMISMSEAGQDLQGESVNAVLASVQIDVTANTKKSDAKTVIYAIIDVLKTLRFDIISLPIYTKEDDVHRAVVRARRMIGSGDTF
ncbi:MAG: hypothetical protein LUI12_01840 [Clostridiales bacterium]|nr:hypothetical protein [Clostridiales bacterium]